MCICCLFTTQLSLVILGQILAARTESWYRKLEFSFTSFCFYYHRLWWSSWHAMLALLLWHLFLVWIFSWRDLFQVTGTVIICSQFITCDQITLCSAYYAWFLVLLASPYAVLLRTCPYLFLAQFDSSVYIRIHFELCWPVQSYIWGRWSYHFIDGCPYCWDWT